MKQQVTSNGNVISSVERTSSGILTSFLPFQRSDLRSLVTSEQSFPHITVSLMAPVSDFFFPLLNCMSFSCSYFMLKACHSSQIQARLGVHTSSPFLCLFFRISSLRSKRILLLSSNVRIKMFIKYFVQHIYLKPCFSRVMTNVIIM